MDYEMPRMNGPDTVTELRKRGCTSIIIGVTGNALRQDIGYFRDAGVDAVLTKPLAINDLLISVAGLEKARKLVADESNAKLKLKPQVPVLLKSSDEWAEAKVKVTVCDTV